MEPFTLALSAFLGACLFKAGEKFSEKAIETVFEQRKEIAEGFTSLFKEEIITLGLADSVTPEEVRKKLAEKPEIITQVQKKLDDNPELVTALNEQLQKISAGITINAKNIGQIINKNEGTIIQNNTFS